MRILLSFQLWLLPPLDEGKKGKAAAEAGSWSLFIVSAQPVVHVWGAKLELQSPVEQWRLRCCACASLFRYFNSVMPREKKKV